MGASYSQIDHHSVSAYSNFNTADISRVNKQGKVLLNIDEMSDMTANKS